MDRHKKKRRVWEAKGWFVLLDIIGITDFWATAALGFLNSLFQQSSKEEAMRAAGTDEIRAQSGPPLRVAGFSVTGPTPVPSTVRCAWATVTNFVGR
jgi:hypothetical protein